MDDSIIDFLKDTAPGMLEDIKETLSNENNRRIMEFLSKEQGGEPHTRIVPVEKNGFLEPLAYNPVKVDLKKFTSDYISDNLGIGKDDVKKSMIKLSQRALISTFIGENGYYCGLTNLGAQYVKEVFCRILPKRI